MDRKLWFLPVCVAGLIFVAVGQKSVMQPEPSKGPRYQIVAAKKREDGKMVFVLDTNAGSVWKYQTAIRGMGNHPSMPEAFVLVGFGVPREDAMEFGLRHSASEDSKH